MSQCDDGSALAELHGGTLSALPHIRNLFNNAAEKFPDVEAVVSLHQNPLHLSGLDKDYTQPILRWTYTQLYRGASHLATRLEQCGVRRGSAIAFFSQNRAEWVLLCWTSVLIGCPFVPLNPRLANNRDELRYILHEITPSVIVAVDESLGSSLEINATPELEKACLLMLLEEKGSLTMNATPNWTSLSEIWSAQSLDTRDWNGNIFEDTVVIGFTSGTTSIPKACPQSSDNLMASAVAVRDLRNISPPDRLCQHLPGFAAMAVLISLTFGVSGATIVYPSPSFSAVATLDAIERERCTYTFAAPAIVKALVMSPSVYSKTLGSLRIIELGGAPIYPEILQLVTAENGLNCKKVGCGWGMTESPCPLLADPWERTMPLPSDFIAVGKPIKGTHAKICALGSCSPINVGEEGELHVGGPQIVRGYLNGNNEVFYEDHGIRWIKTGDMARIEDGRVYIVGRYKDIIIRGGHNISPSKIERRLEKISGLEAQVVGVLDDLAGEVPVAVVKLSCEAASNTHATHQQLHEMAMKDLGPTERPYAFVLLDELNLDSFPTTLSGKVQKAKLAELVHEYLKQSTHPNGNLLGESATETVLVKLWSEVSGVPIAAIDSQASVFTFADSITAMRLSTLVKKRLQKDLTVDDMTSHQSIHEQVALLKARKVRSTIGPLSRRTGPPTMSDMVHCEGDPKKATLTENLATPLLSKLGMSWNDVEDIFPAPDTSFIYLNRRRPQTWNQRMIYLAPNVSAKKLITTWQEILVHHSMFRTLAIPARASFGQTKHLFAVLHPNEPFWKCSITTGLEVSTPEDLRTTFLNEWADTLSGPIVRIAFVSIKSTNSSAFILVGNHAAYDNLSMDLLFSDLEIALSHNLTAENILQAPGHTPFKKFAEMYWRYRSTPQALQAATFHANRLRGIGELKESLWPKSQAPGRFKGSDEGWTMPDGTPGDPRLRRPFDLLSEQNGLDGLTRTAPVTTLTEMKDKYGIMPHVILKVAVALFNMRQTRTNSALFANVEAGRRWPSPLAARQADEGLLNPLGVAGPMFQVVLNHISVCDDKETVLNVLRRTQEEQKLLSEHSQAPLFLIESLLGQQDGDIFFDAISRQGYNWAPGIQSESQSKGKSPSIVKFNRQALDDIGLAWTCGLQNGERFYINASYDDCQLGKDEVYEYLGQVLSMGVWLADPENVEKQIGEVSFDGVEVSGLIKSLE